MRVLTVLPNPGEHRSSSSTWRLGSIKNSFMSWPDLKFDQDTHVYLSRWDIRKQQLAFGTYLDSLENTPIYF